MSQGDSPQSRESRHACRDQIGLKRIFKKKFLNNFFFKIFFWPRLLPHHPPSTPESFMLMGLAMWVSISNQLHKSAVLSYQSLTRYRSLGFDHLPNYQRCRRRHDGPADLEPDVDLVAHHVLHVARPLAHAVHPADGDDLAEAALSFSGVVIFHVN